MKNFEAYRITISEKDSEIIKKYLEKVSKYVEKHNLDKELYSDIEEGIFEKLEEISDVKNKDVMKIINEMGEPEDIFDLEESSIKREIDFGEAIGKGAKTAKESSSKLVKHLSENGNSYISKAESMVKGLVIKIWEIFKGLISGIFEVLKFFLEKFGVIIGILVAFVGFILLTSSILAINFELVFYNVEYLGFFPLNLKVAGISFAIGLIFLGIGFIIKKVLHPIIIISFVGSIGVTVVMILFTLFNIGSQYSLNDVKIEEIKLNQSKELVTKIDDFAAIDSLFEEAGIIRNDSLINVYESKDDNFILKVKTKFFGNSKEDLKNKKEILNDLIYLNGDIIAKEGKIFKEKTAFFPFYRKFELYIPKGGKIDVSGLNYWEYYFKTNCKKYNKHYHYSNKIIENNDGEICKKEKGAN